MRLDLAAALVLIAPLLSGGCAPNLKEVKSTLDDGATVGIAYEGRQIALLDSSIDGRLGLHPDAAVPDAYRAVGLAVRDTFRAHATGARVALVDPASQAARAAADVHVRVNVDGAYFCAGGLIRQQTCTLSMRATLLIEDHRTGTNTPLDYSVARRSAEIPGSENWASISLEQAQRAVPPASLANLLANEIRQDLDVLLRAPQG
ncbi:MAG: hypothetical protein HKM95_08820 [Inquilinus sp.]|nr:hypothetical protein [Inquilinus sp.]